MKIILHSKDDCIWCERAREYFEIEGLTYEEIKHNDPADRERFYDLFGLEGTKRTMPQIMIDNVRIGGFLDTRLKLEKEKAVRNRNKTLLSRGIDLSGR